MKKNNDIFQMIILPNATTKKEFLNYIAVLQEQDKDLKIEYDSEHHIVDLYYKQDHVMLRLDGKSFLPYMNFIEGFLVGKL